MKANHEKSSSQGCNLLFTRQTQSPETKHLRRNTETQTSACNSQRNIASSKDRWDTFDPKICNTENSANQFIRPKDFGFQFNMGTKVFSLE